MGGYGQGANASLGERRRTRQIRVGAVAIGGGAPIAVQSMTTTQTAGLVFDQYSATDYKFVALDIPMQRIIVGHQDPLRGLVIEQMRDGMLENSTEY